MKRSAPVYVRKSSRPATFLSVVRKAVTPKQQADAIAAIADKYESTIRRKIIEAFDAIKGAVKIGTLATLIEQNAPDYAIFEVLGLNQAEAHLGSTLDAIADAAAEAGAKTAEQAGAGIGGMPRIMVRFDRNSPLMVDYLREQSADLVTRIADDTRQNIRAVLGDMVAGGKGTPISAARQMRDMIGLTPRQQQAVENYRQYLMAGDMRAYARNIGGNADRIIAAAFRDGTMTAAKADKLVEQYRARLLQYRGSTVSQTESFRAANAGAHAAWRQIAEKAGIDPSTIRRFWIATNDDHTRDAHREIPHMNAKGVGIDQPFQSPLGPIMFPGDPNAVPANSINCRCALAIRFTDIPAGFLPPMIAGRSILPPGSR